MKETLVAFLLFISFVSFGQSSVLGNSCQHSGYKMLDSYNIPDTSQFSYDKGYFYKSFVLNQKVIDTVVYKIDSLVSKKFYKDNDIWIYTKENSTNNKYIFVISNQQDYTSIDQFYFYTEVTILRNTYFLKCKTFIH